MGPNPEVCGIVQFAIFNDKAGSPVWVPAIITKVWSDSCVNLRVFTDNSEPVSFQPCSCEGEGLGSWRWPPRS